MVPSARLFKEPFVPLDILEDGGASVEGMRRNVCIQFESGSGSTSSARPCQLRRADVKKRERVSSRILLCEAQSAERREVNLFK